MIRAKQLLTLTAAATLAACTLEPAYHRPDSSIQNAWPTGPAYAAYKDKNAKPNNKPQAADIGWREFFIDPQLQAAIKLGLENNRDLRVAALKVQKAQAMYRIQRGDLFPSISANAADTIQHVSARARTGFGSGGSTFRTFTAGIGFASYQLDFFGRIRSLNHKQLQLYLSQIEARKSAQISLVSEIANDYVVYLADLELAKLAKRTYKNQQRAYSLIKQSYDAGVSTALDLSQAEQAMDAAHADVAKFTRTIAQARNLLLPLLGAPPPASILNPRTDLANEQFMEALPAGLPSDLLSRRPDILEAEHQLKAANANIGAARAAFFPSISLTGNFGTASSDLSGLFANNSEQWTFAPTISIP
ncbi:MAG: efflux transporter outer membrane subunit, partial [Sinobacteraceae bacterium]|nr:efflux transporter outer membrane subunit [Nevskiaceae bacterium]